ncbi:MAG: hypothetical protein GY824_11940 [Delftia sp.]|nr:hypothetical protein [Delftia sp.]
MQSGQAEYLYGPLAFYHTRAPSTVGVALLDEFGQAGPYFDADPEALTPVPLIPAEIAQKFTPPPGPPPAMPLPSVTPMLPIVRLSTHDEVVTRSPPAAPGSSSWERGLLGAAFLTGCVLLMMGGVWLRRRRERKGRGGEGHARTEGVTQ